MNLIDEYIQKQDPAIQASLNLIRNIIRSAIPEATERISYQMPTYWKGQNIIHFAAAKNHIGIYPGGEATTVFADMADEIFVINVGGYIGSSTRSEIEYAMRTGKSIRYLEEG